MTDQPWSASRTTTEDTFRLPARSSRHGGQWPTHRAKARRAKKVRRYQQPTQVQGVKR